jgi:hypothetical membrane protein
MKKNQVSFIFGILASAGYLLFTIFAYTSYPLPFSPMSNWLSDLGNPVTNPQGAVIYNLGIILTAAFLIVFFLGLSVWKIENLKAQIIMLRFTQVFGILGSFCMMMSGFFPINSYKTHSFWSTSLYILLSTAFIFSAAMLRYHPTVPRWLLLLGITTAVLVILSSFLLNVYILEWITVFTFLIYVTLLGMETKKK